MIKFLLTCVLGVVALFYLIAFMGEHARIAREYEQNNPAPSSMPECWPRCDDKPTHKQATTFKQLTRGI